MVPLCPKAASSCTTTHWRCGPESPPRPPPQVAHLQLGVTRTRLPSLLGLCSESSFGSSHQGLEHRGQSSHVSPVFRCFGGKAKTAEVSEPSQCPPLRLVQGAGAFGA